MDTALATGKNVTMHELGHAHGIDHHLITGNIMYDTVAGNCTLGSHDISDYEDLWGES